MPDSEVVQSLILVRWVRGQMRVWPGVMGMWSRKARRWGVERRMLLLLLLVSLLVVGPLLDVFGGFVVDGVGGRVEREGGEAAAMAQKGQSESKSGSGSVSGLGSGMVVEGIGAFYFGLWGPSSAWRREWWVEGVGWSSGGACTSRY